MMPSAPGLFGICARKSPIVAILRRGPSAWTQLLRWQVQPPYEVAVGAWLRARVYPQRCGLSDDGRHFGYLASKATNYYRAVSRLPWFKALSYWPSHDYDYGFCFQKPAQNPQPNGVHGNLKLLSPFASPQAVTLPGKLKVYDLVPTQFSVERRTGWAESKDTPAPRAGDTWDQKRSVTMEKTVGEYLLQVTGDYGAWRSGSNHDDVDYSIVRRGVHHSIEEAQWADFAGPGLLAVATRRGVLEIRDLERGKTLFSFSTAQLTPDPQPPPGWASNW